MANRIARFARVNTFLGDMEDLLEADDLLMKIWIDLAESGQTLSRPVMKRLEEYVGFDDSE